MSGRASEYGAIDRLRRVLGGLSAISSALNLMDVHTGKIPGRRRNPVSSAARNPRRAYDHDGREIPPMTLGNMRAHGVRTVMAHCQAANCAHSASIDVDALLDHFPVPDVSLRLRCSRCGSRNVKTQPAWREGGWVKRHSS